MNYDNDLFNHLKFLLIINNDLISLKMFFYHVQIYHLYHLLLLIFQLNINHILNF